MDRMHLCDNKERFTFLVCLFMGHTFFMIEIFFGELRKGFLAIEVPEKTIKKEYENHEKTN